MKKIVLFLIAVSILLSETAYAVKYINGYTRRDGTYVSGHYRDTSNDGYEGNNANYLGYNG